MSYTAALQEADKTSHSTLSLFNVNAIEDIDGDVLWENFDAVEDSCNKLNRGTSSYLDPIAVGGFILREGSRDIDWVWPVVDRLNLSFFTSVVWSNSGSYDEAISVFFQLLVPEHLHDRDEVIDMFLDLVTRRKLGEKGWPTDEYTMQEVVNKMKEDIENDMEDEDQSLRERVLNAFNKRYGHVDTMPWDDLEHMTHPQRMKETWFKLLPIVLGAIENKVDLQQAKGNGSGNAIEISDDDNDSNAEKEDGQEDDFYDAPTYFGNDGDREDYKFESIDDEFDELEDEHETPDESHTGMKRSHNQEEDDVGPVDKRKRREPVVISEWSAVEPSQESYSNREGENDDISGAWGEDSGSNIEDDYRDGAPLSGGYSVRAPGYARRSTSHSSISSVPRFHENASSSLVDPDPHFNGEETSNHSDNRMENENGSSQAERLPHGLANTINLGAVSPIPPSTPSPNRSSTPSPTQSAIQSPTRPPNQSSTQSAIQSTTRPPIQSTTQSAIQSSDDHPTTSNLASYRSRIEERGDIARSGTTRAHNPLLISHTSNAQQQDDQINNQPSASVTATLPIQPRRRHHRRELPDIEIDNATAPVPQQQNGDRLRKLNEYWTDEEVAALDEGLRTYSRRWVAIKARFPDTLRNRTNVQLKDKARNIARQRRKEGLPLEHYEGCG